MTTPKDKRTTAHAALNVGNNIDLMARFNAPGYSPWNALKVEHVPVPSTNDQGVANHKHALREKATRVNRHNAICVQGGESIQRAAIRRELEAV